MPYYLDKEYHPVIEDFINEYTEGTLEKTEAEPFEELLFVDDDLRELTIASMEGKLLLEAYRKTKALKKLAEKLLDEINKQKK